MWQWPSFLPFLLEYLLFIKLINFTVFRWFTILVLYGYSCDCKRIFMVPWSSFKTGVAFCRKRKIYFELASQWNVPLSLQYSGEKKLYCGTYSGARTCRSRTLLLGSIRRRFSRLSATASNFSGTRHGGYMYVGTCSRRACVAPYI